MAQALDGVQVWVARSETQAKPLSDALTALGAEVIALPVINIDAIAPSAWPELAVAEQDMLIFVSRNAVSYFMAGFDGELSAKTRCVAVGAATAETMAKYGLSVAIQAPPPAGSESLLTLPAMQSVAGLKVLIVRGENGRELLAETLTARGAEVQYLPVYRRTQPDYVFSQLTEAVAADWIVVMSVAALHNLCAMVDQIAIQDKKLLVVSERIKQVALELGFEHVAVSKDVCDSAVVERIVEVEQQYGKSS